MDNNGIIWTKTSEEVRDDGYFALVDKTFLLPNGKTTIFTVSDKPDVVTIFMLTPDSKLVITKQFRAGAEKIMYDPPGGYIESYQTPEEAAIAELTQETGYKFEKLVFVGSCYQDAYESRKRYIFIAFGCEPDKEQMLEPTEFIELVEMPLVEYYAMVLDGQEVTDALVVLRALLHLGYLKPDFPATP